MTLPNKSSFSPIIFLINTFFFLNLIRHSRKHFDYAVREPHLPQLPLDYTNMSVYLALDLGHHYISLSECVSVCVRDRETGCASMENMIDSGLAVARMWCEWTWCYEEREQGQEDSFRLLPPSAPPPPVSQPLRVFAVGKFIWVSVNLLSSTATMELFYCDTLNDEPSSATLCGEQAKKNCTCICKRVFFITVMLAS